MNSEPIHSSPALLEFYASWLEWVLACAPHRKPYSRKSGLCANLFEYLERHRMPLERLHSEMEGQFRQCGLCTITPFNRSVPGKPYTTYNEESDMGLSHANLKRLQWAYDRVFDMLVTLDPAQYARAEQILTECASTLPVIDRFAEIRADEDE